MAANDPILSKSEYTSEANAPPPYTISGNGSSPGVNGGYSPAGGGAPVSDYGSTSPTPGGPPTYTQVTDPHGPPPSYESLYGELRHVRDPKGFGNFLLKSCNFCCNTIVAVITIALFSIIPIAMIVIGSMFLYKCEAEKYIPIYLIVGGVFGLFQSICHFCFRAKKRRSESGEEGGGGEQEQRAPANPFDGIIGCFLLAWFIAGSVWVYRTYQPDFVDEKSNNYCHPVCFWFAFAVVTVTYVSIALLMLFLCCCGCCVLCLSIFSDDES